MKRRNRIRENRLLRVGGSSLGSFLDVFVGLPGIKRETEAY